MEHETVLKTARECDSESAMIVRPITSDDGDAYRSILARTTEEDRYCRFFHAVNHFDLSDIRRFVDPRPDAIGFIAEDDREAYGAAHAFFLPDRSAEIAIVVARDVRRHGVGHALLERLIDELRARHFTEVIAFALSANSNFAHLAASMGMVPSGPAGDLTTWTVAVPLTT